MPEKLTSRKLWVTVIMTIISIVGTQLGEDKIQLIAAVASLIIPAVYVYAQGMVDAYAKSKGFDLDLDKLVETIKPLLELLAEKDPPPPAVPPPDVN